MKKFIIAFCAFIAIISMTAHYLSKETIICAYSDIKSVRVHYDSDGNVEEYIATLRIDGQYDYIELNRSAYNKLKDGFYADSKHVIFYRQRGVYNVRESKARTEKTTLNY